MCHSRLNSMKGEYNMPVKIGAKRNVKRLLSMSLVFVMSCVTTQVNTTAVYGGGIRHSWRYSAQEATITARCNEEGCQEFCTISLTTEEPNYTGIQNLETFNEKTGLAVSENDVKLYEVDSYGATEGGTVCDVTPTEDGDYYAALTVEGVTAVKAFYISNIPAPSPSPEPIPPSMPPSAPPSVAPSAPPSIPPSVAPSAVPSEKPVARPTMKPTVEPSIEPSVKPSVKPSVEPTVMPSKAPSAPVVGTEIADKTTGAKVKVTDNTKKEVTYIAAVADGKKVTVPDTVVINGQNYKVTKIDANAFKNNKKLKTITILSTKLTTKSISKKSFKGLSKKTVIKVPKKQQKAYQKLFKKKGFKGKVKSIK